MKQKQTQKQKRNCQPKQKLFIDIHLYDDNMHTIYRQQHSSADNAIKQAEKIINKKIRGI